MSDYRCEHGQMAMGRDCPVCQEMKKQPAEVMVEYVKLQNALDHANNQLAMGRSAGQRLIEERDEARRQNTAIEAVSMERYQSVTQLVGELDAIKKDLKVALQAINNLMFSPCDPDNPCYDECTEAYRDDARNIVAKYKGKL